MKIKIAVLGNSHLAAFKLGWEIIKEDFPNFELTFFGSPTTSMRFFKVDDDKLVPTNTTTLENIRWTSNGYEYIPGNMDAYILVGMGYSFVHLMDLVKNHRLLQDYDKNDETKQLISENFLNMAMSETLQKSNAITLIDMLQHITKSPLIYTPNPYASEDILNDVKFDYYHLNSYLEMAYNCYLKNIDNLFCERKTTFVKQPEGTITNKIFTKEIFSKNSVKLKHGLNNKHEESDHFHMNAEFGAISLRDIFLNYDVLK